AGVWEIEVEARRTSPYLDNSFKLDASVLGVSFDPATQTVPEAKIGTPAPVQWKVTNNFAGIEGKLKGGSLGSAKVATGTIKAGETQTSTVTIGAGVEHLDVSIGNTSDAGADLDLYVLDQSGKAVAQSTTSSSNESVSLVKPAAGTYTIQVAG
ncbi:PPC domain-containing protein, partial [Couchioplanes caeruleus subsp. azureus]